jgi:hypothetical protein
MVSTVTNPDRFFGEEVPQDIRLSALVVLLAGVANMTGALALVWASWETIRRGGGAVTVQYAVSIAVGVGNVFVSWMLYAASFYALSAFFDGDGSFRRVVTYVAWGFVPTALAGLLRGGVITRRAAGAEFPDAPSELGPFVQQLTAGPMFDMLAFVGIVCTVWSGFLWLFAVKHARDVSVRGAALTVVGPITVSIGMRLLGYL